jgi:inosose dehydratase
MRRVRALVHGPTADRPDRAASLGDVYASARDGHKMPLWFATAPRAADNALETHPMKAKLGIAPIAWWNDDLPELSDDVSLEECMAQAREAGFTGMETGQRFPMDADALGPILKRRGISVCGGWFSGLLLDGDIEAEKERIAAQMALFKAVDAPCIVYGETAGTIQGDRSAPLAAKRRLSEDEIKVYGRKMTAFGEWCAEQGVPIAYHHHMAAPIETEQELDLLMRHSGEGLPLLYDAGHMAFAGGDVLRVIDKHHARIAHVHVKDVRREVIDGLDRTKESFLDAVIKGAFTVPGDGSLDFEAIVKKLASYGYEGWFVVEAEQDPAKSPPLKMAKIGHKELLRVMAAAGYEVAG